MFMKKYIDMATWHCDGNSKLCFRCEKCDCFLSCSAFTATERLFACFEHNHLYAASLNDYSSNFPVQKSPKSGKTINLLTNY